MSIPYTPVIEAPKNVVVSLHNGLKVAAESLEPINKFLTTPDKKRSKK